MKVLTDMFSIPKPSFEPCSPVRKIRGQDRGKKGETHIITNPLNIANNPAFKSQKLLTKTCIPTSTVTPTAGIMNVVNITPSTNGRSG